MSRPKFLQLISTNKLVIFGGYLLGFGSLITIFGLFLVFSHRSILTERKDVEEARPIAENYKLTLLGDTFSGYSTFRSREFYQSLKQQNIDLNYVDEFSQVKRARLLNQGQSDLLVTSLDQFVKQQPQGKIVGLIDRTVGADAVVLNNKRYPQLKSLQDLHKLTQVPGQMPEKLGIVFASDTPSEYLTLVLSTKFEAFNLSNFEINRTEDSIDAWQRLQDPSMPIAVAVLWEPYVTQAKQQGYNVVISSKDAPEAIVDVIVASNRLLKEQPQVISNFLSTYYSQVDPHLLDSARMREQIAVDGSLSLSDASAVMQGINFFTAIETRDWLTSGKLRKQIEEIAAVLVLAGKISKIPEDASQLYASHPIQQAANNTQSLLNLVKDNNPELADRLAGKKQQLARNSTAADSTASIGNLQIRGEVGFNFNSNKLSANSQKELNRLAKEISSFNSETVAVKVIGHTSRTGQPAFNLRLSKARAETVASYLRQQGLEHKVVAEGKGSTQPLSGIPPSDPRNQYTEIRLVRLKPETSPNP